MASSSESSLSDTDENLVDCTDFNMTHQRLNKPHVTSTNVFLMEMSEQIGGELIDNDDCDVSVSNDVKQTERVLKDMFPALSKTSQQFNLLTNLVKEFLLTRKLPNDSNNRAEKVESIVSTIVEQYPNRCFFQLISRWSRTKKLDFVKDCLNTTCVLMSHFPKLSMSKFLDECRTFEILPSQQLKIYDGNKKKIRNKLRIKAVKKTSKFIAGTDTIVEKLNISIQLMYARIQSMHHVSLSQIRMNSVQRKFPFQIKIPRLDGTKDVSTSRNTVDAADHSSAGISINTQPLTGFHMPRSFTSRVWSNILVLKLCNELFKFIFGDKIMLNRMYLTIPADERVLQFVFKTIASESTKRMCITFLVNICLVFPNLLQVRLDAHSIIESCCHEGMENRLVNLITGVKESLSESEVIDNHTNAYNLLNKLPKRCFYHVWAKARDREKKYQAIRWVIFRTSFQFKGNHPLRKAVMENLYPLDSMNESKSTTDTPSYAGIDDTATTSSTILHPRCDLPLLQSYHDCVDDDLHTDTIDCNEPNALSTTFQETPVASDILTYVAETFDSLSIVSANQLSKEYSTALHIQTEFGQIYVLETAPMEVYSAGLLKRRLHWRTIHKGNVDYSKIGVTTVIRSSRDSFFDKNDVLHVVRPESGVFRLRQQNTKLQLRSIVNLVLQKGTIDEKRRNGDFHRTISFGVKPELEKDDNDLVAYGNQHFNGMNKDEVNVFKSSLGSVVDFIWEVGNDMQQKSGHPSMATNQSRTRKYARLLNALICCNKAKFEIVTIVITLLSMCTVKAHFDVMNDGTIYAYSKTITMNIIFSNSTGTMFLMQIIGNFREAASNASTPYSKEYITWLKTNFERYHNVLRVAYNKLIQAYTGSPRDSSFTFDPTNLQHFFLDDEIVYERMKIVNCNPKAKNLAGHSIERDLLLLPIGVSRSLSLSMVIDYIHQLRDDWCADQVVEFCFIVSFHNSQLLICECLQEMSATGIHPYYEWRETTMRLFGTFQGGKFPRFSTGSNNLLDIFPGKATRDTSKRLKDVVESLFEWIDFIDSYHGKEEAKDIPYLTILAKMKKITANVSEAANSTEIEFGLFRLSIFTTLICTLGIVKPGRHLHQVIIPIDGSSATKHLINPNPSDSNNGDVHIQKGDYDHAMETISSEMGWHEYNRSKVEIHLCESQPGRCLVTKDVFRRGQAIFDLSEIGVPVRKEYGSHGGWIPIFLWKESYAFITSKNR